MNRESKLHGNSICTDCENLIKALDAEILSFNGKIEALKKFADNDSEGDSVEAMNSKCLELSAIIEKMIEGDRKDIQDLKLLMEKVRDVYIDGEDVLEKMDTARREADECYDKAASLSHAASMASFPWEKDYLNGLASASRSQGESWDRIYDFWKGQAELYDEIDADTSTLFAKGILYHRQASAMIESFLQCKLTSPSNSCGKNQTGVILRRTFLADEETKYNKIRVYLINNVGLTNDEIDYIQRNHPELLISLYDDIVFRSKNKVAIIAEIKNEIQKFKDKYSFVLNGLKRRLNLTDKEAEVYLFNLEKDNKLSSLWATYHYSQEDYYAFLDDYCCDIWINEQMIVLNKYLESKGLDWTEEKKKTILEKYYYKYQITSDNSNSDFSGGAAEILEKDIYVIEWSKIENIESEELSKRKYEEEKRVEAYDNTEKLDEKVLEMVKRRESLELKPYNNGQTVGYGFDYYNKPDVKINWLPDGSITEEEADRLLKITLEDMKNKLNSFLSEKGISLSQGAYVAVMDLLYNRNLNDLTKEIIVAMADNDKKRTKELMEDFDYRFAYKYLYPNDSQSAQLYVDNNPGLKDRREEEYNWFLQGNVE